MLTPMNTKMMETMTSMPSIFLIFWRREPESWESLIRRQRGCLGGSEKACCCGGDRSRSCSSGDPILRGVDEEKVEYLRLLGLFSGDDGVYAGGASPRPSYGWVL